MRKQPLIVAWLLFTAISLNAQETRFPNLKGPYLGQKPPGITPEVFAPGIISTPAHEYGIAFSKDARKIYLKRMSGNEGKNLVFVYKNRVWHAPEEVQFGEEGRYGEFQVTPDGKYLLVNKIILSPDGNPQSTIAKFTKAGDSWIDPFIIGPGMRATGAKNGNIYVTHILDLSRSLGEIGRYTCHKGMYGEIEILEGDINRNGVNSSHPFIAPDESYLIFNSKRDDNPYPCLYLSFNLDGKSWSVPINLSRRLNTGKETNEWIATVSPDGKFLFYNCGSDIYWVSAEIIEELRPKK